MARPSTKHGVEESGARKVQRVQLDLSPTYIDRLNELKIDMQAASYAEVVREAVKLLSTINKIDKKYGVDELIAKQEDGTEKTIIYLGR